MIKAVGWNSIPKDAIKVKPDSNPRKCQFNFRQCFNTQTEEIFESCQCYVVAALNVPVAVAVVFQSVQTMEALQTVEAIETIITVDIVKQLKLIGSLKVLMIMKIFNALTFQSTIFQFLVIENGPCLYVDVMEMVKIQEIGNWNLMH